MAGFICVSKICYQRITDGDDGDGYDGSDGFDGYDGYDGYDGNDGYDGYDGGDDGGDPGGDDGGDPGGDQSQAWLITPGVSVGPLLVSQGMNSVHTLGEIQGHLGEAGTPIPDAPFALAFRNDTLWISGIDSNDSQVFDAGDSILSIMVRTGFDARTAEGLGPDSTRAQVRAVAAYANPDYAADLPPYGEFPGGKVDEYFSAGVYFGYDEAGVVTAVTVARSYRAPNATIDPANARIGFGATWIACGDGYQTGSKIDIHRGALGLPDWSRSFTQEITLQDGSTANIDFYLDSYRIQGMEFLGGDDTYLWYDVDRLVAIALYPMFYGTTASGHGIGSTRAEWESELGAPVDIKVSDETGAKTYVYQAGSKGFAIYYNNNGDLMTDQATWLMLNFALP